MAKNPIVPDTSTTLLRDVADARHARWRDFVARYEPMMRAYVRDRFPELDAEEIVQATFVEFAKVMAHYEYDPDEKGRFHNYLTGILRHKALRRCREDKRDSKLKATVSAEPLTVVDTEEDSYRQSMVEMALARFFADREIAPRTKEVFRRVAVAGEDAERVARAYQMERHAVDQLKSRSLAKLREFVEELESADAG